MKSKLKFVTNLLALTLLTSGCAGNTDSNSSYETSLSVNTNATQTTKTIETTSENYPENVVSNHVKSEIQFDFEEALNNIYIAGKKVSFPDKFEDLHEDFELRMGNAVDGGKKCVGESIMYNGFKVGFVILKECTIDNYSEKSKVAFIGLSHRDKLFTDSGIYKFRIGDIASKDDVKKYFGKPTEEKINSLKYKNPESNNSYIEFWFGTDPSDVGIFQIMIAKDDPLAE